MPLPELATLIADALHPANFFTAVGWRLESEHRAQVSVTWEIFSGRLLAPTQTRSRKVMDTWNLFLHTEQGRSNEPILSVKLDREARLLHVTRAIECWTWEPYDAGGNVILSREVRKWVPELVGTIALSQLSDRSDLRDELRVHLFQSVVGCSRLPLTSSEAPMPAFSLGQFGYLGELRKLDTDSSGPMQSLEELLAYGLTAPRSWLEKAKLLELVLRSAPPSQLEALADRLTSLWSQSGHAPGELWALFRTLFNEVALSPWTAFVDKTLTLLRVCVRRGHLDVADLVDFLSYVLRQLGRHLTAYDLITFHHRGANYPDALLLDAALKLYLELMEQHPELFLDEGAADPARLRIRRRALRQGWLLRHQYEGLPVPDLPTSPGENLRVLPPPFVRIPEEQILDPAQRTRRLFADDPLTGCLGRHGRDCWQASVNDLVYPAELHELGMALFVDRPLGVLKAPGEPDQTLLLSHEAFSVFLADQRLRSLFSSPTEYQAARERLRGHLPRGQSLPPGPRWQRPGVVSLRDADRAAPDFVFLRTTRQAVRAFLDEFDFAPLAPHVPLDWLHAERRLLILADPATQPGLLCLYDDVGVKRLELRVDGSAGYSRRRGQEFPVAGLQVVGAVQRIRPR